MYIYILIHIYTYNWSVYIVSFVYVKELTFSNVELTISSKSVGQAGRVETQASINAGTLRQNFCFLGNPWSKTFN